VFDGSASRDGDGDGDDGDDAGADEYLRTLSEAAAHDAIARLREQPETLSRLLLARRDLAGAAARAGVLASLPLASESALDANMRIVVVLARERPAAVTAEAVRALMGHAGRPAGAARLLTFMSVFVRTADEGAQAGLVLQLFLDHAPCFVTAPAFVPLLLAAHRNPAFEALRPAVLAALAAALLRPEPDIARPAFAAFCALPFTMRDIPVLELVARAGDGLFPVETIELFARLPALPVSTRLIAALVAVGGRSPLTAHCLCRLALSLKGAQAVLAAPRWMDGGCLAREDAVALMLVVCRFAEVRDALADVQEFYEFAGRVAREGSAKEVEGLVAVLRRIRGGEAFVRTLDGKGFFEAFFPRAMESQVPVLQDGALLLAAAFARIVWVNGFVWLMQYLPGLVACGGAVARKSIVVALLLSAHPQAKAPLRLLALAPVVADCEVEEVDRNYKERLLAYIRA
jgi:hypothetical protein